MSKGIGKLQRAILKVLPDREHDPLSQPYLLSTSSGWTVNGISHALDRPERFSGVDDPDYGVFMGRRGNFAVYRALRSLERRGLVYRVPGELAALVAHLAGGASDDSVRSQPPAMIVAEASELTTWRVAGAQRSLSARRRPAAAR